MMCLPMSASSSVTAAVSSGSNSKGRSDPGSPPDLLSLKSAPFTLGPLLGPKSEAIRLNTEGRGDFDSESNDGMGLIMASRSLTRVPAVLKSLRALAASMRCCTSFTSRENRTSSSCEFNATVSPACSALALALARGREKRRGE